MFDGRRLDQRFRGAAAASLFHEDVPGNSSNLVRKGYAPIRGDGFPCVIDGLTRVDATEYAARRVGSPQVAKAVVGEFLHYQQLPIRGQFRAAPWARLPHLAELSALAVKPKQPAGLGSCPVGQHAV